MLEVKPVEIMLNGGKVQGKERSYPVVVIQEASLAICSEVTQSFRIQEAIWSSPLSLNLPIASFLPFCGLILNKLLAS